MNNISKCSNLLFNITIFFVTILVIVFLYFILYKKEVGNTIKNNEYFQAAGIDSDCYADYGSVVGDSVCCGQKDNIKDLNYVCPENAPLCVGYEKGKKWGKCRLGAQIIESPDNFYDLTTGSNSIFSNDNNYSEKNKIKDSLGASQICIYTTDEHNTKITDIECLNTEQFRTTLELPDFRLSSVCIEEECLGLDDFYVLNGDKSVQIVGGGQPPSPENKNDLRCLMKTQIGGESCSGDNIDRGISTLKLEPCYQTENTVIQNAPRIGSWGWAEYKCPDGSVYGVGDISGTACDSIGSIGGSIDSSCNREGGVWSGKKVICKQSSDEDYNRIFNSKTRLEKSELSLNDVNSRILTPFTQSALAGSVPGSSSGGVASGEYISSGHE